MTKNRIGVGLGAGLVLGGTIACTSCFVRGTRVRTPSGTRPIEELAIGDEVVSFVESTMALVVRRVVEVHVARVQRVRALTVGGRRLVTTEEHPFWDAERRRWTRAGDLAPGDVLAVLLDDRLAPAMLEAVADEDRDAEVFNLTVEGPEHTYLAEDVAVHNKDTSCEPSCPPSAPVPTATATATFDAGPAPAARPAEYEVRVTPIGGDATIHDALLSNRELPIPEELYPVDDGAAPMLVREGEPFPFATKPLAVVGANGYTEVGAAVLDVRARGSAVRARTLVAGATTAAIAAGGIRAEGSLFRVPIGRRPSVCTELAPKLELPVVAGADLGKRFVLPQPTSSGDCIKVSATPETPGPGAFTLAICGGSPAWPFAASDVVILERPSLLTKAPDGLRLVRATDGKALELARLTQTLHLLEQAGERFRVLRDARCAVLPSQPACGTLSVRGTIEYQGVGGTVYPETPLPLSNGAGRVFLLQATRGLFSATCATDVGVTAEIAAVSGP